MQTKLHNLGRALAILAAIGLLTTQPAEAATTTVTQTVTSSALTLSSPATATMTPIAVDVVHNQTATGSLGAVNATDSRGSAAGWSVTATASSFTKVNTPVRISGSAGGITVGGNYTQGGGTFTVTIVTAGSLGTAQFTVDGMTGPQTTSASDITIGTTGITIHFAAGSYQVGDQWTFQADSIAPNSLSITPSIINAMVGSYSGVHPGAVHTFAGPTDSATIMSADPGYGQGWYIDTPSLSLQLQPATRSGNFVATITETIN